MNSSSCEKHGRVHGDRRGDDALLSFCALCVGFFDACHFLAGPHTLREHRTAFQSSLADSERVPDARSNVVAAMLALEV